MIIGCSNRPTQDPPSGARGF